MTDEPATSPVPTEQDRRNAAGREAISARQAEAYGRVLALAWELFGEGWLPSGRHYLLSKDEEDKARKTGERAIPAADVYTVRHEKTGEKRHFVVRDGKPVQVASYEDGFGPMLLEPDPVRTIEVRGQKAHPHRYSLCWAPFELYTPKTAEQLAALRVSRERRKAEREERKWQEENPLLAFAERQKAEEERGR
jgi:hypothetical protein